MYFAPLILAAGPALGLLLCWRYEKAPRILAFCAALTAFLLAFAFPSLLTSLAGLADSDKGMLVLVIVDLFTLGVFVFEAFLAHKFHPVMTPFLCTVFGFAMAFTYTDWPQVSHRGTRLLPKTAKAISKDIQQAHAAHQLHGQAAHQQLTSLYILVGVAVAVLLLWRRAYKRRLARGGRLQVGGGAPQPILTQGTGAGVLFRNLFGKARRRGGQRPPVGAGRRGPALDGPGGFTGGGDGPGGFAGGPGGPGGSPRGRR